MSKQTLLEDRGGKNYDAVFLSSIKVKDEINPEKITKIETWALYKRVFLFFWKRVAIGTPVEIINKARNLNRR